MSKRVIQQDGNTRWSEFERNDLISQIRTHVFCVYRSTLDSGWHTSNVQDTKDRLYYILAGGGSLSHHGQTFDLTPGGLYLIPAHTLHSHTCDGHLELYWCHFCAETCYGTPLFAHLMVPYCCHPASSIGLPETFAQMVRLYHDDSPGAVFRRSGLLMQALAPFIEQVDMEQWRLWQRHAEPFQPALALINSRIRDPLSNDELARAAHLSRGYFISRFKQIFGISPYRYHLLKRIEMARHQLRYTSDTLSQISEDLGFADAFHFSRLFKKLTGRSPSAFRADYDPNTR